MSLCPTIEWLAKRTGAADAIVPRQEAVAVLARFEQLETDARRWYHADGSSELLESAEAVVERRIRAARELALAEARHLSAAVEPVTAGGAPPAGAGAAHDPTPTAGDQRPEGLLPDGGDLCRQT